MMENLSNIDFSSNPVTIHPQAAEESLLGYTKEQYSCPYSQCPFTTNWKSSLNLHMRTHTDERPFQCALCNKHFKLKHHLKHHILTHSQHKPFKCQLCDYRTGDNYSLQRHRLNRHRIPAKRIKRPSLPTMVSLYNQRSFQLPQKEGTNCFLQTSAASSKEPKTNISIASLNLRPSAVIHRSQSLSSQGTTLQQGEEVMKISRVESMADRHDDYISPESSRRTSNGGMIEILDDNSEKLIELPSMSSPESIPVTIREGMSTDMESPEVPEFQQNCAIQKQESDTSVDASAPFMQSSLLSSANNPSLQVSSKVDFVQQRYVQNQSLISPNFSDCKTTQKSMPHTHNTTIGVNMKELSQWKCQHCGIIFPDNIMYGLHMGCHAVGKPFQCNVCGKLCNDKHDFMFHFTIGKHNT